jgi:Domain of unknown function (DUF4136)
MLTLRLFCVTHAIGRRRASKGESKMKRTLVLLTVLLILGSAFVLGSVQTDYDRTLDFSRLHTYEWGRIQAKDSLWEDRIRQDINQQLQAKGWQLVPSGSDVTVLALANSKTQQEEQTFYSSGGWRWGPGVATTSTYTQKTGVLVVAMFDSKTHKLAWRGTASGDLADTPDKNIAKFNKAVSKMFQKFPPKK